MQLILQENRLIGALLSDRLREYEKLDIIEKEYKIPLSNDLRREVDTMCSFSHKAVAVADDAQHLIQVCIYLSVPVLFIFLSLSSTTDIYYGSILHELICSTLKSE